MLPLPLCKRLPLIPAFSSKLPPPPTPLPSAVSDIPLAGIVAGVRVGMVNGALVVNPTNQQLQGSPLDLVVAGTTDSVLMIEGSEWLLFPQSSTEPVTRSAGPFPSLPPPLPPPGLLQSPVRGAAAGGRCSRAGAASPLDIKHPFLFPLFLPYSSRFFLFPSQGYCNLLSEEQLLEAVAAGQETEGVAKPKLTAAIHTPPADLLGRLEGLVGADLEAALRIEGKKQRGVAIKAVEEKVLGALTEAGQAATRQDRGEEAAGGGDQGGRGEGAGGAHRGGAGRNQAGEKRGRPPPGRREAGQAATRQVRTVTRRVSGSPGRGGGGGGAEDRGEEAAGGGNGGGRGARSGSSLRGGAGSNQTGGEGEEDEEAELAEEEGLVVPPGDVDEGEAAKEEDEEAELAEEEGLVVPPGDVDEGEVHVKGTGTGVGKGVGKGKGRAVVVEVAYDPLDVKKQLKELTSRIMRRIIVTVSAEMWQKLLACPESPQNNKTETGWHMTLWNVDVKKQLKELTSRIMRRIIVTVSAEGMMKSLRRALSHILPPHSLPPPACSPLPSPAQYTFPPSSVGETGRAGFTSRREVGHGALAERSLEPVLPDAAGFPYTVRVESTITESNGSSRWVWWFRGLGFRGTAAGGFPYTVRVESTITESNGSSRWVLVEGLGFSFKRVLGLERLLEMVLPDAAGFPYTVRVESTITESNGSSRCEWWFRGLGFRGTAAGGFPYTVRVESTITDSNSFSSGCLTMLNVGDLSILHHPLHTPSHLPHVPVVAWRLGGNGLHSAHILHPPSHILHPPSQCWMQECPSTPQWPGWPCGSFSPSSPSFPHSHLILIPLPPPCGPFQYGVCLWRLPGNAGCRSPSPCPSGRGGHAPHSAHGAGRRGRHSGHTHRHSGVRGCAGDRISMILPPLPPLSVPCSMASVCGGCLAMLDAGVPLRAPVAGVAMGLILHTEQAGGDGTPVILTDILGSEDALGDMDFKVAGSAKGVTAFQMDIKVQGITIDVMRVALERAKQGRLHILGEWEWKGRKSPHTEGSSLIERHILGSEDALGDMDFKVAGSAGGVTAFQMDIKVQGITIDVMRTALERAKQGRLHVLGERVSVTGKKGISLLLKAPFSYLGSEDALGDMDFKVAGSARGGGG
ncbi:unnamed protein product [Closterium sp. NIES-54]